MGMSWLVSSDKMEWKASESTLSLRETIHHVFVTNLCFFLSN